MGVAAKLGRRMVDRLKIYFAAALRGGADFGALARRIELLEAHGDVLTRHMASPRTADLGHDDDRAIFEHDQRLLAACDVFIADLSAPSTGAGFMAARAVAEGKPALCLLRAGQRPSAMIAGCPAITTRVHEDEAGFRREVRAFLLAHADRFVDRRFTAPRIFLAGAPGSGKGTLGRALAAATGAPHVSTGELLRDLVARGGAHPHAATIAACMQAGQLVPAAIMQDIVLERLRRPDCRLFGFLLDGYPPSRADLANLTTHGLEPDLVLFLECSDATSVARQVGRAARSTDTPDKARTRLAVFHGSGAGYDDLARSWYPDRLVVRLDAERPPAAVEAEALETIEALFGSPRRGRSFAPTPPFRPADLRSTRVHFHVDARSVEVLREVAREVLVRDRRAQGQLKLYPIAALHLGPQVARRPVYRQMPNFHEIEAADDEAFITGRLGDGDTSILPVVLEAARRRGGMVEVEEYVGEWTLGLDGGVTTDSSWTPLALDLGACAPFAPHLCRDLPRLELHLGFDAPKDGAAGPPVPLPELMAACAAAGLDNGGWFIFKAERTWNYRSNEFSDEPVDAARARLEGQARALRDLLAARGVVVPVAFSLEVVHAIWVV